MTIAELLCAAYVMLALPNADVACDNMHHVVDAAEKYEVEPSVMVSLIFIESRFKPLAVSRDGACGLTQVLPRYAAKYYGGKVSCRDLFNPRLSIYKGTHILGDHLKRYRGNYKRSLCSYNAGASRCRPGGVRNKGHRYARRVVRLAKKLRRVMKEAEMKEIEMKEIEMRGYTDEDVPGCYE